MKRNGIAILYISHRLAEIFEICENVTVLKDGKYVDTFKTKSITTDEIVSAMVGRDIENLILIKRLILEIQFLKLEICLQKKDIKTVV